MPLLEPPDFDRCQADVPNGHSFMTLGGKPGRIRCSNEPVLIATEKEPGKDGQVGSMSLCARCVVHFVKQLGSDYADLTLIVRIPRRRAR